MRAVAAIVLCVSLSGCLATMSQSDALLTYLLLGPYQPPAEPEDTPQSLYRRDHPECMVGEFCLADHKPQN